jgi:hypothetical protein
VDVLYSVLLCMSRNREIENEKLTFCLVSKTDLTQLSSHLALLFLCRRIALVVAAIIGFLFSVLSVVSCRFFQWESEDGDQQAGGLFGVSYRHDACISYDDLTDPVNFEGSTKAARAFGVMATIFSGIALIMSCGMCCFMPPGTLWKSLAVTYLCAFVAQPLTFLVWKQVNNVCKRPGTECSLGIGSIESIVASVVFLIMGFAVLFAPAPKDTAYKCPLVVKAYHKLVALTGITRKKNIGQKLRTIGWAKPLLVLAALAAFALSVTVIFDCRLYSVSVGDQRFDLGLFRYYYPPDESCRYYETGDRRSFYTSTKTAQVFGVLAAIFGGILFALLISMTTVFNYPKLAYTTLPVWAFLAFVSQGLIFLTYKEARERECRLDVQDCKADADTYIAAIATFLYLVFVPLFFMVNLKDEDEEMEEEGELAPKAVDDELEDEKDDNFVDEQPAKDEAEIGEEVASSGEEDQEMDT